MKKMEKHFNIIINMMNHVKSMPLLDTNSNFLKDLSTTCFDRFFPCFNFAARKFIFIALMLICIAPTDQHLPTMK